MCSFLVIFLYHTMFTLFFSTVVWISGTIIFQKGTNFDTVLASDVKKAEEWIRPCLENKSCTIGCDYVNYAHGNETI